MARRTLLLSVALSVALAALGWLFAPHYSDAAVLRPFDYLQYHSAADALLHGQNPYDGAVLYPRQQTIGTNWADPVMMWNPPWTLPLVAPLGAMHWRTGQLVWFALQFAAVLASAILLWRTYAGKSAPLGPVILLTLGFAPTLFLLLLGQISGLLILGLAGFLWAVREKRFASAGSLAALTAIKPHLFVPFAMLLMLEAIQRREARRSLYAGGILLAIFGAIPLMWNPEIWNQYREATGAGAASSHNTIHEWVHPTLGYAIRQALPGEPFRAMFLPLLIALPVVAIYWYRRRANWDWAVELPRVVTVSLLAAPYGAWGFDLVVLLIPVVQAASCLHQRAYSGWHRHLAGASLSTSSQSEFSDFTGKMPVPPQKLALRFGIAFGILNLLALLTLLRENSMTNPWFAPAVALAYLAVSASVQPKSNPRSAAVPA